MFLNKEVVFILYKYRHCIQYIIDIAQIERF